MDKSNTEQDASALATQERTVLFNGQDVTVRPLNIGQILQVSPELNAVLPAVDQLLKPGADEAAGVLNVITACGPAMLTIVQVCTGLPHEALRNSSDVAGLSRLVVAIVGLNASFFGNQLGEIRDAIAELASQLLPVGQMPSTPSSTPATA